MAPPRQNVTIAGTVLSVLRLDTPMNLARREPGMVVVTPFNQGVNSLGKVANLRGVAASLQRHSLARKELLHGHNVHVLHLITLICLPGAAAPEKAANPFGFRLACRVQNSSRMLLARSMMDSCSSLSFLPSA